MTFFRTGLSGLIGFLKGKFGGQTGLNTMQLFKPDNDKKATVGL